MILTALSQHEEGSLDSLAEAAHAVSLAGAIGVASGEFSGDGTLARFTSTPQEGGSR